MKRIIRGNLGTTSVAWLAATTTAVMSSTDREREANRKWKTKNASVFADIRNVLDAMASGRGRCMYCEDSRGTDVEHFRPKSTYPEHAFDWHNYLLACSGCNSNHKRTQFPLDSLALPYLIDPTSEDPRSHLVLTPTTGEFGAISAKGQESIEVFDLNGRLLPEGRRDAWLILHELLRAYEAAINEKNAIRALQIQAIMMRFPFGSVMSYYAEVANGPGQAIIPPDCRHILASHPQIIEWLA